MTVFRVLVLYDRANSRMSLNKLTITDRQTDGQQKRLIGALAFPLPKPLCQHDITIFWEKTSSNKGWAKQFNFPLSGGPPSCPCQYVWRKMTYVP